MTKILQYPEKKDMSKSKLVRLIAASMCGNALEFYDFTLYGFFVAIIAPQFFPAHDPIVTLISGLGVFALGFFTRPLGALVFGHIGDKLGRKRALSTSIILMAVPTTLIGLLPTYDQIGALAPTLLILCRLIQGFCAGGEYNGAVVFVVEHAPEGKKGLLGSSLTSSGLFGALIATGVGAIFSLPFIPSWGWRIPFMLGAMISVIGFYLRRRLEDTPEFIEVSQQGKVASLPFIDVLRNHFPAILCAAGVGGTATVPFYIVLSYMNPLLVTKNLISSVTMMLLNAAMLLFCMLVLPIFGFLGDRIGYTKIMHYSAIGLAIVSLPAMFLFSQNSLTLIICSQLLLMGFMEAYVGPSNAFLCQLFPPQHRYTGIAFGYCLGLALFGGIAPYISAKLVYWTGNPLMPVISLVYSAVIGLAVVFLGKRILKQKQQTDKDSSSECSEKRNTQMAA